MDRPETDPMELLAEIACPDERARTAREFGLWADEYAEHATAGGGLNAAINGGIFNRDDPAPTRKRTRARRRPRRRASHRRCPRCGFVDA